ncbi:DUF6037 family protein [Bacillus wiedmannii]|uniref:DUF6037 family protein n=2 Tax=Bacillus wiedmannii TaxID=1890302 RepID=UPI00086DA931|nr:DUF6037 family protein [Bacillus wiedmannii]SCN42069.1 Uncharacterized protein BCRIVMBC938_06115 [Bacillus wiedmannii]
MNTERWGNNSVTLNNKLLVPANSASLLQDASILRDYFGIDYGNGVGNAIQSFYRQLSLYIPTEVSTKKTTDQEAAMVESLSTSDKDNTNKIYCYSVRKNPEKPSGGYGEAVHITIIKREFYALHYMRN